MECSCKLLGGLYVECPLLVVLLRKCGPHAHKGVGLPDELVFLILFLPAFAGLALLAAPAGSPSAGTCHDLPREQLRVVGGLRPRASGEVQDSEEKHKLNGFPHEAIVQAQNDSPTKNP